jgi:hypothetical protein
MTTSKDTCVPSSHNVYSILLHIMKCNNNVYSIQMKERLAAQNRRITVRPQRVKKKCLIKVGSAQALMVCR